MTRRGVGDTTTQQVSFTDDPLLTRKEVGALLRVSQSTLSRWAEKGVGPVCTWLTANCPRYARSDVEDWIRRNRSAS